MKSVGHPVENPQAAAEASASQDALTKCEEMSARTRTYRIGADGYGASAGWVATTGRVG